MLDELIRIAFIDFWLHFVTILFVLLFIIWGIDKLIRRRRIKKHELRTVSRAYFQEEIRLSKALTEPTKEYVDLSSTVVFANGYRRSDEWI